MPFGTLDLSIVTDHLLQTIRDCIETSELWAPNPNPGFNITVTGNPPDIIEKSEDGCMVSLYLFHVAPDPYQRNNVVLPGTRQLATLPYQPLALDLYYLLTAYSSAQYVQEQQAMSIAVKCLYEHTFLKNVAYSNDNQVRGEFVLTMEVVTSEEMGRIWSMWQSFTVPSRLSVIYKAGVIFVRPPEDERVPAPNPEIVSLSLAPAGTLGLTAQLLSTSRHVRFIGPEDVIADPDQRDFHDYDLVPAVVAPNESFLLYGTALAGDVTLSLLIPNQPDQDITGWLDPDPENSTGTRLRINVPANPGVPAGVYQLRATIGGVQTNATPFSLAARVNKTADPPVLEFANAALTVQGAGFVAGNTEVFLETVPLVQNAGLNPGQFSINGPGTSIQLMPPEGLPPGRYGVRVRVNGIESTPAMWVVIP